jgi:hypothetical protein
LWERDVGGKGIDLSAKIQLTIRCDPSVMDTYIVLGYDLNTEVLSKFVT